MYYTATLITMAGLDITKAYFASRIRKFITTRVLKIVYILSGILMFGLGLYFILK
jgi:threonine/homoserine/homoserine lactone efflux protein